MGHLLAQFFDVGVSLPAVGGVAVSGQIGKAFWRRGLPFVFVFSGAFDSHNFNPGDFITWIIYVLAEWR
jgi:hypothetical protein